MCYYPWLFKEAVSLSFKIFCCAGIWIWINEEVDDNTALLLNGIAILLVVIYPKINF